MTSYITTVGNLAKTPELREGEKGAYCYARVLVTDRIRNRDTNEYEDGATVAYDVAISGNQAENLVAAAQASGNVRVIFSGRLTVTEYEGDNGVRIQRNVRAEEIGVSLRGQTITVDKGTKPAPEEEPWAATDTYGDDTPF